MSADGCYIMSRVRGATLHLTIETKSASTQLASLSKRRKILM